MPITLQTGHILEFEIGQTVYLKTDKEQLARLVTNIMLRPDKSVSYCIVHSTLESWHYGLEIDSEKNQLLLLNN